MYSYQEVLQRLQNLDLSKEELSKISILRNLFYNLVGYCTINIRRNMTLFKLLRMLPACTLKSVI
jgi:hypothetical protein